MALRDPDRVFHHRLSCLKKTIETSSYSWNPNNEELLQILHKDINKTIKVKIYDAAECFLAATKLEQIFFGPAILLYVAAVEAFQGEAPDIELKKQIKEADQLFKEMGIRENKNIIATRDAAYQRAIFQKTTEFLVSEIGWGLQLAGYPNYKPYQVKDPYKLAEEIVEASNKVRHEGRSDKIETVLLAATKEGTLEILDKEKEYPDPRIRQFFQFIKSSYMDLITPARIGSANVITKRIEELKT